jgi:propionyl-CoA synthetase
LPAGNLLDLRNYNSEFKTVYLNKFSEYYFSEVGRFKDEDDYIYISKRVDDMMNVVG